MSGKDINLNQSIDFINKYLKDLGINKTVTSSEVASIFENLEKNEDGTVDTSVFALAIANAYSDVEISSIEDEYLEAWEAISGIDGDNETISENDIKNLETNIKTEETTPASTTPETTGSTGSSGGSGGTSGNSGSGITPSSQNSGVLNQDTPVSTIPAASITGNESVEELEAGRSEALAQLSEKQALKYNNEAVIEAEQAVTDAQTNYTESMEAFEENAAELYEKVADTQELKEQNDQAISDQKSVVDGVKTQISEVEGNLASLNEPPQTITVNGEEVENPDYATYLQEKAALEAKLADLQATLTNEEATLTSFEEEGVEIDTQLAEILNSQEMQENEYAQAAKEAFMAYIDAQANLSIVKAEQTAQIDADIAQLRENVSAYDSAIDKAKNGEEFGETNEKKSDMTLEEFLDSIEDPQTKEFYEKLYELYDFDSFNSRSDIPQYFQTVYTDAFATGTIRSAGCGITSLAMIASYLTGENITPDMLTNGYRGDNPASAMHAGIKNLGLNVTTYEGWGNACADMNGDGTNNLDAALDAGKPVIARVLQSSIFTDAGHFIVIAGKTDDGKYIVNDPNLENYYKQSMVDGFTNGFTREQITNGLAGIYIVETNQ